MPDDFVRQAEFALLQALEMLQTGEISYLCVVAPLTSRPDHHPARVIGYLAPEDVLNALGALKILERNLMNYFQEFEVDIDDSDIDRTKN